MRVHGELVTKRMCLSKVLCQECGSNVKRLDGSTTSLISSRGGGAVNGVKIEARMTSDKRRSGLIGSCLLTFPSSLHNSLSLGGQREEIACRLERIRHRGASEEVRDG